MGADRGLTVEAGVATVFVGASSLKQKSLEMDAESVEAPSATNLHTQLGTVPLGTGITVQIDDWVA